MSDITLTPTRQRALPAFTIIEETSDYLVVNKAPLLLMHPSKPDGRRTLWDELRQLLAFELANGGQISLINRLDRETSGLVLVAKTALAARDFGLLMQTRQIAKEYHALVWGWPEWDSIAVDAPMLRRGEIEHSAIYLKQMIHPSGAKAQTNFEVVNRFHRPTSNGDRFSLVKAFPRTGRTHQIRVHLAHLKHPIVGDKIYGPDERHYLRFIEGGWKPELAAELLLSHHALHASRLRIDEQRDWHCPPPEDSFWQVYS